jgi:hypothetical protein
MEEKETEEVSEKKKKNEDPHKEKQSSDTR